MGIIRDGTISGRLPSAQALVVHYPGYPSSLSRAIETLGGMGAINQACSSNSNKLELRFRPEDPYSHPVAGQLYHCNNFLLRICTNKSTDVQNGDPSSKEFNNCSSESNSNDPKFAVHEEMRLDRDCNAVAQTVEPQTSIDVPDNLSADIVARVHESYNFDGMADYQHVPAIHADAGRKKRKIWAELEGQSLRSESSVQFGETKTRVPFDMDDENLMILLPQLFAPKDIPENLVLRPSNELSSKKKHGGVVHYRWEMEIEPSLAIDFNIKEIPKVVNWEKHIPRESDQWKWQLTVSKLFDERPIWPKSSISERLSDMGLKCGDNTLKRFLFRSAYYFANGPFHRLWIRKGYDPRTDPESRIYQRIDFRLPPPLRGYYETTNRLKHRWEDVCAFRVFPYKSHIYLQLFELCDDYIQEEIRKPSLETVCTPSTGWFSSYFLDNMRLRITMRFLAVFPQSGAEHLLKSVSQRFDKSKKMRYQTDNSRSGEAAESQANQETMVDEDKAKTNDDEEENDIEEDEEEMDAYYPSLQEADYSLQTDSYLDGENISRTYLQDLFGSFPVEGGSHLHDLESHGEYEIYEQDGDGNSSEDDYY